ncbi:uncharacterized protein L3040_005392 [Drepanopeziza brunnea f. sp. 'multigermtubi']|uniref:CVNH domain-containing protein n=1 Tax=Marssonina brunnea f. sp. multigermtubi (strain MB_m1) TaxID=1072389 RepID=K1WHX5_MARBU|nr:CVNH domain-containing protein [Drepanopeziza brunnea f. sp. 'multigermtubi' MB_m1]EKD17170.1 CVNH domain-containing protein [Drepanopeziza brunnea f. sp. 'multigermtubi' MB_m1]KAJ5041826.1 hypothetical protein L3040_005392 [Drepanopeziza brunnea f. sp. 'multigermtubi']
MSFHASAQDVRVEDNHILKATLTNAAGEPVEAELDLDNCIGNQDGRFEWGGQGFSDSGQNFSFGIEGGEGGEDGLPILRGELSNVEGEPVACDINLSERIENRDGELVFV